MAAFEVPTLLIEKGTDFEATFTILDVDGTLIDLSGNTAVAKLKKHPSSSNSYEFDIFINSEDSTIRISMTDGMTATLPNGRCYFDVLLTYGNTTTRPITGTAIVSETSSR